jgi:L-tartrate/succinate antiporter
MGVSTTPDRLPASTPPGAASAVKPPHVSWKALAPIAVAIVIALIPAPAGLAPHAWYFFAIFAGVIVGLML